MRALWSDRPNCSHHLDGGHSALVIGFLVETNFGGLKNTIFQGIWEPQKLS